MQNFQKDHMALIAEYTCLKILQAGLRMFMYVIFIFLSVLTWSNICYE